MTSSSTPKLTLKLVIDKENERVLFAEASKSVVDFLLSLLCLPLGTAVKLLGNSNMVGSIGNLYESVENLNHIYMLPNQTKDVLLNPSHEEPGLLLSGISTFILEAELDNEDEEDDEDYDEEEEDEEEEETEDPESQSESESEEDNEGDLGGRPLYYKCPNNCSYYVTCDETTICPRCNIAMNIETHYVGKRFENGYVKDSVTFLVMDDLAIQPMSALSVLTILNKLNVKEIGTFEEMVVELGMDEGIELLKASLQSKMVLTSVFIKKY
ncbi:hypothetical protein RYX36_017621 [Vicia faba]